MDGTISRIETGSLADELELVVGDKILAVNGQTPLDIIDLSFQLAEEEIELLVEHADGEREVIAFDKDVDEELGAEFSTAVFDGVRRCKNHCVFCFVDMIAPNMRETLSVKDDDYRLSFLFGNFITLTNLTAKDFRRIKNFHLSPLFVSVHTMNPELRAKMLRTPRAAKINEQLDELERAGVEYHTQVVLCKDLNDGAELDFTIEEILKRRPHALSLAIVPVGVTRHRRDKFPLKQFDKISATKVIAQVERFQKKIRAETGRTFVYLGDEFYFLAEKDFPPAEFYDDFPQIENGIGMTRNFIDEFNAANELRESDGDTPTVPPLLKRVPQVENGIGMTRNFIDEFNTANKLRESDGDTPTVPPLLKRVPQIENGIGMTRNFIDELNTANELRESDGDTTTVPPLLKRVPQIENGIGMTRNFIDEFNAAEVSSGDENFSAVVVCGTSIAKVFEQLTADKPNVRILPVVNKFFGERVNVSGLLTGGDIIDALKNFGGSRDVILIPSTALKSGEEIFLDDVSLDDLRKILAPAKVLPIHNGAEFRRVLTM